MNPPNYVRISLIGFLVVAMATLFVIADAVHYAAYQMPVVATQGMRAIQDDVSFQLAAAVLELRSTRKGIDAQLAAVRGDLNWNTQGAILLANARLADTNDILNSALAAYEEDALLIAGHALRQTQQVVDQGQTLTNIIVDTEPMYRSRYLAVSGELMKTLDATRRMANEGARVAPELAQNMNQTVANVATITADVHNYTKPESWWRMIMLLPLRSLHINIGK